MELCRKIGDDDLIAPVLFQFWVFNFTQANHDEAMGIASELQARTKQALDPEAKIVGDLALGLGHFALGNISPALEHLEAVVRSREATKDFSVSYRYGMDVGAVGFAYTSWCYAMMGRSTEARDFRERLVGLLERVNHPYTNARGLNWCSMISATLKHWQEAAMFAERGIELASQYDIALVVTSCTAMRSIAKAALSREARTFPAIRQSISNYGKTGARLQVPFLLSLMAEIALDLGDESTAQATISEALSLISQTGERQVEPTLLAMRERIHSIAS